MKRKGIQRVKKLPTKINVGGVMYYHYVTVDTKRKAEDYVRDGERHGYKVKLKQYSSSYIIDDDKPRPTRRPTKIWYVYIQKEDEKRIGMSLVIFRTESFYIPLHQLPTMTMVRLTLVRMAARAYKKYF